MLREVYEKLLTPKAPVVRCYDTSLQNKLHTTKTDNMDGTFGKYEISPCYLLFQQGEICVLGIGKSICMPVHAAMLYVIACDFFSLLRTTSFKLRAAMILISKTAHCGQ